MPSEEDICKTNPIKPSVFRNIRFPRGGTLTQFCKVRHMPFEPAFRYGFAAKIRCTPGKRKPGLPPSAYAAPGSSGATRSTSTGKLFSAGVIEALAWKRAWSIRALMPKAAATSASSCLAAARIFGTCPSLQHPAPRPSPFPCSFRTALRLLALTRYPGCMLALKFRRRV